MTVIANSGPLIHLSMVSQFHLLQRLFQSVSTIPRVIDEVVAQGNGRPGEAEVQNGIQDQWIRIVPVSVRVGRTLRVESGDGEAVCDVEEWRVEERETS